jgi:hypothetical protein
MCSRQRICLQLPLHVVTACAQRAVVMQSFEVYLAPLRQHRISEHLRHLNSVGLDEQQLPKASSNSSSHAWEGR